ncbi:MAG TPA: adenylate/guanylate cyclase domain-containing protein [Candidatus Wallbacteria bacterium]|nr:adenylate/guanylate cyclase domain-containing protein [Candidatus Wallbacteria bacterium]
MADIFEHANQLKDNLIKLMKSFEPGTVPFINAMTLAGKLRKALDETTLLATNLSNNREDQTIKTNFEASRVRLEKIIEECETVAAPKSSTSKSTVSKNDKTISIPKELTFVSLDVQGSEDLKKDEEQSKVSRSFSNFHDLVDKIFKAAGVKKSGWAGDGFIAYFENAENALTAVLNLRGNLTTFNIKENSLSKNFRLRIGISTGEDYFEEGIDIGKMTSKIIDLAGYLQKKAEITTSAKTLSRILVSVHTILKIHKNFAFQRTLKVEKAIIAADESKKIATLNAYEIIF